MGKQITKAYILNDGELISEKEMNQFAIKGSKQIPPDKFKGNYNNLGLVEPLYNPEALAQLLEINTFHYRACKTKARDTTGNGWILEPIYGLENPSDEQWERAMAFLDNPNPAMTLSEICHNVMVDFEAIGDGYFEVIRKDGIVVGLEHIPSHTMRVHTSLKKFCQIRGPHRVWFKRFGVDFEIDATTGEEGKSIPAEKRANEVIHIRNYTSRSDFYGIPDILPALGVLLADRERTAYNIAFFENHAIPAYVVTITGADLDEKTEKMIQRYFQEDVKKNRQSTLVLTAKKDENDISSDPIEIKFQALSTETKEASFRMFRQDNRDEILTAHGVPPYRAGVAVVGNLGGTTAQESTEIYKQSVIRPRQEMLENVINRYILQQGLGITDWKFKFNVIDSRDKDKEVDRLQKLFDMGVYSPNQILEKLGEEPIDDPNMDRHFINGHPIDASKEEINAIVQSMKNLHEKLISIATKGKGDHV